ncbi:MAG TPA: PQQ-binding-like beta-propeller repeat protein [Gemmataceae bacterium]|nr:PQQ-binding-like beta-propeller repeat protein [Gemmataceae bacterium]
MRQRIPAACLSILLLLLAHTPAWALVKNLLPLKDFIASEQILVAQVEKVDPSKPALVLKPVEDLKGKQSFGAMPVNMTGDTTAQREKHPEQLFKRLAPDMKLILFVNKLGNDYLAFVYTNGTWFQIKGVGPKQDSLKWSLTSGEPYLRRTFKGSTDELRQTVVDILAKKKEPPKVDEKEPPGFGPEVKPEEKSKPDEKKDDLAFNCVPYFTPSPPASGGAGWGEGGKRAARDPAPPHPHPLSPQGRGVMAGPPLAVVPTFVIIGPLAILALLFPTVFGGLALLMRRWMAALSVSCTISTLYFGQMFFLNRLSGTFLATKAGLWGCFAVITALGAVWAGWRYRQAMRDGDLDVFLPRQWDGIVLCGLSVIGVGVVAYALFKKASLLDYPWLEVVASWVPIWAAAIAAPFLRPTEDEYPPISLESVFLWALVFGCTNVVALETGRSSGGPIHMLAENGERVPRPVGVVWSFEPEESGMILSTPLVTDDRVYVAVEHAKAVARFGRIYALDSATGKVVWRFDSGLSMKGGYCTPTLVDGKLYVGEGLHENNECRMFCLDASTGEMEWEFKTTSHTESKPLVENGKIYFGAGDDGIYCLNLADRSVLWHHEGHHVDANIIGKSDRLFVGSGVGEKFNNTVLLCLDSNDKKVIWNVPVDWAAFAPPALAGSHVYFGIGNGNALESNENPRGALLCIDANSGKRVWQADARDAVLCKPAFDLDSVFFTSRDGNCYCVNRTDGHVRWRKSLGAAIASSPWLVGDEAEFGTVRSIYVAASDGRVACLDADNGRTFWTLELAKLAKLPYALIAGSPVVVTRHEGGVERRRIYVGGAVGNDVSAYSTSVPRLYCFEDEVR